MSFGYYFYQNPPNKKINKTQNVKELSAFLATVVVDNPYS